ncbi:hypothetical protein EB093_05645 [bacterium]|nr:hypothetical protein [bacterium]
MGGWPGNRGARNFYNHKGDFLFKKYFVDPEAGIKKSDQGGCSDGLLFWKKKLSVIDRWNRSDSESGFNSTVLLNHFVIAL